VKLSVETALQLILKTGNVLCASTFLTASAASPFALQEFQTNELVLVISNFEHIDEKVLNN
jgi:hypothetical protein